MKIIFSIITITFLSFSALAQSYVSVTAVKTNLRGTPDAKGVVITTADQGDSFELLKQKGVWFLVQTPKYVGWVHGNNIKMQDELDNILYTPAAPVIAKPVTRTTAITDRDDKSPFQSEYVGGNTTTVYISNGSNKILSLVFGGVRYTIDAGVTKTIEIEPGTYDFTATAPGVIPYSGTSGFDKGYLYKWRFYIVTK